MKERLLACLGPVLGLCLFGLAILILHHELERFHFHDILAHLNTIQTGRVLLAVCLTILSYLALTGYDALAFRYIHNDLAYPRIALASFVGYVFSHNIGLSFFGGSAARYRILSSWGIRPGDIARVIVFNLLTFWLGFLTLAGVVLVLAPVSLIMLPHAPFTSSRPLGITLLLALVGYVVWSTSRTKPMRVRGFEITLPRPAMTAKQILLSSMDWVLAAGVLYVLLPSAQGLSFATFLGIYLLGQIIGVISNIPAGLGVFETVLVVLLSPYLSGAVVLGSVVAYRIVYYLVPMGVAVVLLGCYEVLQRRHMVKRVLDVVEQWVPEVAPRALALTTLMAGVLLLVSGAMPVAPDRMAPLGRLLPLPVIEISHLLGSLIGVGLLLLARALQQKVDAAYFLASGLLGAGAVASLLKGFDYEEAAMLGFMLAALLPCRRYFYRQSSLISQSFSASWMVGIAVILIGTTFLVGLAYRHVDYSSELWWQFEVSGQASRSLRALAGAFGALVFYFLARLLRPALPIAALPMPADLERAYAIAREAPRVSAYLALLGDKQLLFHEDGNAFVMYGVEGRTWVSMGDPVGPAEARKELAWRFRELADRHAGRAVFYEVSATDLPVYLDLGLSPRKLGEEARVPLESFSLAGGERKGIRQSQHRMEREGCTFELIPAEAVPPLLDEAQAISNAWLTEKNTREKRFSLGFFNRDYLKRLPLAVVRRHERVVAFANVWAGTAREELSVDLMRYGADAPPGVMEYLFTEIMLWGKSQGYRWFSLGMAPFSGLEYHRLASLWNRFGAALFRYGEHFYNFQGLRSFKDKFAPVWEPRYLASPSGAALPIVLTHVASLISGGISGVVSK